MSSIVPINSQVPAHLQNRVGNPSALSSNLAGGLSSGADYPRISIKAARFRIVEGGVETVLPDTSLGIVIVGANPHLTKAFYATAWNPDAEDTSPDCFSMDGVRPDTSSNQPQNDLCATCPQNAWGSKVTQQGSKIKACSDKKRLAIVSADDPDGPIYLLEVTPAALKGLNKYQKELSMHGVVPEIAKTIVSFDTDASFPKLKFDFGGFLTEQSQAVVDTLFGSDKVLEITGEDSISSTETAQATPAAEPEPTPQPAETAAAPAAAFGEATPAAEPEPTPQPAETAAAPAAAFGKATPAAEPEPTPQPAETAAAPAAAFGKATPAAEPTKTEEKAPEPEPEAAPAAKTDSAVSALSADITALMKEVDDNG